MDPPAQAPQPAMTPYVRNEAFVHSYCHITQFHAKAGASTYGCRARKRLWTEAKAPY